MLVTGEQKRQRFTYQRPGSQKVNRTEYVVRGKKDENGVTRGRLNEVQDASSYAMKEGGQIKGF